MRRLLVGVGLGSLAILAADGVLLWRALMSHPYRTSRPRR